MEKFIFIFLLLFLSSKSSYAELFCGKEFDFVDIEKRLREEEIASQVSMCDFLKEKGQVAHFSSQVFLITLSSGIRAVLKISDSAYPRDAVAEVAAYRASRFLKLNFIPPTVFYNKNGEVGSLQYYVEPAFDLIKKENYKYALKLIPKEQLAKIKLFYFVFGQWDKGPSNYIAVQNETGLNFVLIDNAAIGFQQKARYGSYPFVLTFPHKKFKESKNDASFPFHKAETLAPDLKVWHKKFGSELTEAEIQRLLKLKKPVTFVIWKGRFFRQYSFGRPCYTHTFPLKLMKQFKKLTPNHVRAFFRNPFGVSMGNDFFSDILDRRDQVIHKVSSK